jgi:uncharacterized protein
MASMQQSRFASILLALFFSGGVAAHDAPLPRVVAVSGEGEVSVKPDRAQLSMAVEKIDPDLKKAETEVNRIVRAYLAEAKTLGAKDEHVSTTGVSINPEYVWPEGARERRFTGYRVSRQISVRVENLDKLGDFILRATAAGVNQVNPPSLESSKRQQLEREALAKAAEDARDKAKLLADTLKVRLGLAYRITESGVDMPAPVMYQMKASRAAAADEEAGMGIALGEIKLHANVSVEFELLAP